eukprot:GHRQ01029426.1.p2 GENE.GHRQ01029426.1~~GHRQ01029426.1.p2  ORF type:complete len:114 (+),score=0.09 GHRQ01029426.1:83-424(+)
MQAQLSTAAVSVMLNLQTVRRHWSVKTICHHMHTSTLHRFTSLCLGALAFWPPARSNASQQYGQLSLTLHACHYRNYSWILKVPRMSLPMTHPHLAHPHKAGTMCLGVNCSDG